MALKPVRFEMEFEVKKASFSMSLIAEIAAIGMILGLILYYYGYPKGIIAPSEPKPLSTKQTQLQNHQGKETPQPGTTEYWVGPRGKKFEARIGAGSPVTGSDSVICPVEIWIEPEPGELQRVGSGKLTISNESPCSLEVNNYHIDDMYGSVPILTLADNGKWVGNYLTSRGWENCVYWSRFSS